ncbi:hypothetical protein [Amedibacillus dolichus]|uniref:hypothetical protein n=1 Tax=Amedibacillus dolichus TaxID=31971 RepID=UPI0029424250|nr:hypothetical protein [Amedibacillus dolichus]
MSKSNFFKILLVFVMAFGILPGSSRRIVNAAEENFVTTTQSENEDSITITTEVEDENDTIPEITDSKILSERNARYENRVNYDDVCRSNKNPNVTVKPFQDPDPVKKYWDYNMDNFQGMYNEKDLIDMLWPKNKGEALNHSYRIDNAVINPDYQCFYANEKNGFGESVSGSDFLSDTYWKYNKDWQNAEGIKQTPRPYGSQKNPQTGKPIDYPDFNDLTYLGNYRWQNNSGGYLFTIVTRPKTRVNLYGNYTSPYTGNQVGQYYITGDAHPRIFDITGRRENEHDIKKSRIMYKFEGINNDRDKISNGIAFYSKPSHKTFNHQGNQWRKTPTKPGWYKMRAQVQEDLDQFILPGIVEDYVIYMKKGYKTKFVKKIDGQNEIQMQDLDWNSGNKPDPFDQETKDLFQIEFYTDDKEHKIPVPKYDESQYIFEGWEVEEKYWQPAYDGAFIGSMKYRTKQLNKDKSGNYIYEPTKIDANQHFVLDAKLVAKLRTRKTNDINVQVQFQNDESGLSEDKKVSITNKSFQLKEGIKDTETITAKILEDAAFDFKGYSLSQSSLNDLSSEMVLDLGKTGKFDFKNQSETQKQTTIYANFEAKPVKIKLDPNGGSQNSGTNGTVIDSHYYKSQRIDYHDFTPPDQNKVLKGWAESQGGDVVIQNGGSYKIPAKKVNGSYPSEITLYAVWGVKTATVHTEKHKDSLVYSTNEVNLAAGGIFTDGGGEIKAFELGRFYFDVTPADSTITDPENLDPTKFYVVIERSTDNGKSWQKIKLDDVSDGAIVTKRFGKSGGPYAKVVYDKTKGKWFAPLLGRISKMTDSTTYRGLYRINVAYDDPKAVEKVSTEQEFFSQDKQNGWSQSNSLEVKIIQDASDFIKVPSSITLIEKTEKTPSGEKEVIESVHLSNKVEVVPFRHVTNSNKEDYDWNTPNNALVNGNTGSYNESLHTQFAESKPLYVTVSWDKVLTDTSGQHRVDNIEMYSHANLGSMKENQVIPNGTKQKFVYDGKPENKLLFDFYLKGDKPKGLPEGMTFKGTVTFRVTMKN